MQIIAHRGISHRPLLDARGETVEVPRYRENTVAALLAAAVKGFPVEFDVRVTKDGQAVVSHDDEIAMAKGGTGLAISDNNLTDLQSLGLVASSAAHTDRVPLLRDVLILLEGRVPLHMELKSGQSARAAHEVLRRLGSLYENLNCKAAPLIVSSFILGELVEFRQYHPEVPAFWLRSSSQLATPEALEGAIRKFKLDGVHLELPMATPEIVGWFRGIGCTIRVYTVNDPVVAINLANMKDDERIPLEIAGVFTDFPDILRDALR